MLFGASCILQSCTGREFCNKVVDDLKAVCPGFVYDEPTNSQN